MKKDNRVRYTLRLPSELFSIVGSEATNKGLPLNSLILQILWEWVKAQEKQTTKISE